MAHVERETQNEHKNSKTKKEKKKKTKYQNNISSEPAKLASGRIIE